MWCIYTTEYYSAIKKNSVICSKERMDVDGIMLSEIKSEKDKYCMIPLTCAI